MYTSKKNSQPIFLKTKKQQSILHNTGHQRLDCQMCQGNCRFYEPALETFGNRRINLSSKTLEELIDMNSQLNLSIQNLSIIDVPGDGNCWVYAFCFSLWINFRKCLEPKFTRDSLFKYIEDMETLQGRVRNTTAFETLTTLLNFDYIGPLIDTLSSRFTNGRKYSALAHLMKTDCPGRNLWAGSIDCELNLLATVFKSIIVVMYTSKSNSIILQEKLQDAPFLFYENNFRARINATVYYPILGRLPSGKSLYIRNLFTPIGMEKTDSNLNSSTISFLYGDGMH